MTGFTLNNFANNQVNKTAIRIDATHHPGNDHWLGSLILLQIPEVPVTICVLEKSPPAAGTIRKNSAVCT
jgi:hypothetical protein